ncbi:MAG: nicotinate-nucleotide diphosphorylase (carboxylating), partial [Planctomycetes bacterium]|nr:nicotinate-nucleotide diphosphorylase (carboxylating) [Planctomycetota bacterium]
MNDAARPASLLDHPDVDRLLRLAIDEDVGSGDVTSQLMVPADCRGSARLMTREAIVVCGLELVERVRNL